MKVGQIWNRRDGGRARVSAILPNSARIIYEAPYACHHYSVDFSGRYDSFKATANDLIDLAQASECCEGCNGLGTHSNTTDSFDCSFCGGTGKSPRIYVAGPMSGYPGLNFPAFNAKAAELRALGYVVINPAEINGGADEQAATASMSPEQYQAHWLTCMRKDITELVTCDGIAMLDGWTRSKGATLEHHIARSLGLTIFEAGA